MHVELSFFLRYGVRLITHCHLSGALRAQSRFLFATKGTASKSINYVLVTIIKCTLVHPIFRS